jgi:zinc transporter
VRLNEQVDRVTRYMEDLDMIRERAFVLQDELYSQLSDRMNRIVYMLTVITGIFLPISFLTGLFGVNIGGMPGVESSEAFFFFVFGMAGLVIVELLIFRFLKWI